MEQMHHGQAQEKKVAGFRYAMVAEKGNQLKGRMKKGPILFWGMGLWRGPPLKGGRRH